MDSSYGILHKQFIFNTEGLPCKAGNPLLQPENEGGAKIAGGQGTSAHSIPEADSP